MAPSHEVKWMKWKSLIHIWLFATPWTIQSMEFSRQNTRVDSLFLLQGIFPNQGLNPGLLYCRQILYQLSHKGSPRILEWVAYSFSRGSSLPRNWTGVSCIAGEFFTNWAIREALSISWCWQMWHFPPVIYMTDFLSHFSNIYLNITTYKRIPPPSLSFFGAPPNLPNGVYAFFPLYNITQILISIFPIVYCCTSHWLNAYFSWQRLNFVLFSIVVTFPNTMSGTQQSLSRE